MNELKKRLLGHARPTMCLTGLLAAFAPAAQADEAPLAYVMTVIENQAQGDQVVSGAYGEAIRQITDKRTHRHRFAASNNLCVAYAKTNNLAGAEKACSDALRSSKSVYGAYHGVKKADYAVALSNRGVVRAIAGDLDRARQDFRAAVRFSSAVTAPAENLALLDAKTETVSSL